MQAPAQVTYGGAPKVALPHILLHALDEAVELLVDLRTPQPHTAVSVAHQKSKVAVRFSPVQCRRYSQRR